MTGEKQSNLPLVLMIIWYALTLIGTGLLLLFGLAFGSEAYRNNPMPLLEWIIIAGPFLLNVALLVLTIWLWTIGKRRGALMVCGLSLLGFVRFLILAGAIGI